MDITQWQEVIAKAVNQYARNAKFDKKEDLKQECFLAIMTGEETIIASDNQQQAVFRLCRNTILKISRETPKREVSLSMPTVMNEADRHLIKVPEVPTEDLEEALQSLSAEQQYVLRCSFFTGKTEKEIVKSMKTSARTVRRIKHDALETLRELLENPCR